MKQYNKERLIFFTTVIGIVASVMILCTVWQRCVNPKIIEQNTKIEYKTDTIHTHTTDTLWRTKTYTKIKPSPVKTKTITKFDTITNNTTDTQYIYQPVEYVQNTYADTITDNNATIAYRATTTGTLDTIDFNVKYAEIHNNDNTLINTTTTTTSETLTTIKKNNKWWTPKVGINAGVGYGLTKKQWDCYIGLGVVIPLHK